MPLYHISITKYQISQELPIRIEDSDFHRNAINDGKVWVNDILDEGRPDNAPSRKRAYYAFDNYEHCLYYFKSQYGINTAYFLYEVQLTNTITAPMYLNKTLLNNRENNNLIQEIVTEYWNPIRNWNFLEYLGDTMTIVNILESDINQSLTHIQELYINDRGIARNFLREIQE